MKTKEEMIKSYIYKNVEGFGDAVTPESTEELMQEYSDLTNAKLVEENEKYRRYIDTNISPIQLQSELSAAKERVKELEDGILRTSESWPLVDILKQLVKATDILLKDKGWDGNTWEEMQVSSEYAKKIIINLLTPHG